MKLTTFLAGMLLPPEITHFAIYRRAFPEKQSSMRQVKRMYLRSRTDSGTRLLVFDGNLIER